MKTLMSSNGLAIYQDKGGNIVFDLPKIVLTHKKRESKRALWKRIERALYDLSSDAYGWHSDWEYTSPEGEDDNEQDQEERED